MIGIEQTNPSLDDHNGTLVAITSARRLASIMGHLIV